jgi:predicted ATPase
LLVLDSCEHLLSGVAATVDALLADSPVLRVLATSREVLNVEGEHIWRLGALHLPEEDAGLEAIRRSEAVELFARRARLVQPGFAVVEGNAAAVADVCRQLEGLPLAIELAAAQAGALSPSSMAERLRERHQVLRAASEHRGDRHRSLEATVDWSYRLLDDESRQLLRMLSVFANGFTLDAVNAMTDAADPVELLTRLVDKSLIVWDADASRYRMLESIRTFARARLDEEGEADDASGRHLAWCAALADSLRTRPGASPGEAYDLFGRELDNFRVALVWAASHRSPDAARLAGAVQAETADAASGTAPAPTPTVTWELVARPDRAYFDRVEVDDVQFPDSTDERHFALEGERFSIGRGRPGQDAGPDVDLGRPPTDNGISRQHAVLIRGGDRWTIEDPGSTNGIYLNEEGEPLPRRRPFEITEADEMHIGAWTTLRLVRRDI